MSDEREIEHLKHASANVLEGEPCDGVCGEEVEKDALIYIAVYDAENDDFDVFCHACAVEKWGRPLKKIHEVQQRRRENSLNSGGSAE